MQTKKWIDADGGGYDHDEMTTVAMEALYLFEQQQILDADGEQLFNDLETLDNLKKIAMEQVSESHLDYTGMLYAVNDIKARWFLSESVGLESASCPRTAFIKEVDIAMEGLMGSIGNWFSEKLGGMWKSFKKMFNISEQSRKWLEKNEEDYLKYAAGHPFELKRKMEYSYLYIASKFDIARHLDLGKNGRDITNAADAFYAVINPAKGYMLDTYNWDEAAAKLERIAISGVADQAIQQAMPLIIKKDSRAQVKALPGNIYIATAITPTGTRKTGWAAPLVEKTSDTITLTPSDTNKLMPALRSLVEVTSDISYKFNKEQASVKKAQDKLAKFEAEGRGNVKQLKQDIKNAVAVESAISASLVRTLIAVNMLARQSLKQAT